MQRILFFLLIAFQILNIFLPDILAYCVLIEYAYILLRVYALYLLSFPMHLNAEWLFFSCDDFCALFKAPLRYGFFL
jgi:hypothetical protein